MSFHLVAYNNELNNADFTQLAAVPDTVLSVVDGRVLPKSELLLFAAKAGAAELDRMRVETSSEEFGVLIRPHFADWRDAPISLAGGEKIDVTAISRGKSDLAHRPAYPSGGAKPRSS